MQHFWQAVPISIIWRRSWGCSKMSWQQLVLEAGDLNPEQLGEFFEQQGACSITFVDAADQPIFEPEIGTTPLWSATRVTGLFESGAVDPPALRNQLARTFNQQAAERLQIEELPDRDWERVWLDQFEPMLFGDRLWVCPAGMRPENISDSVIIDLDPGLAFGTGTHATTALCLQWLDQHPPQDQQVLDFGCGSGILAIAALKLGCESVWAVDIDEQALWATRENAAANQVGDRLFTGLPDTLSDQYFDLLLANILANPLLELASHLASLVRPQGAIVLSGILSAQAEQVLNAYQHWFDMEPPVEQDGWIRLTGVRKK